MAVTRTQMSEVPNLPRKLRRDADLEDVIEHLLELHDALSLELKTIKREVATRVQKTNTFDERRLPEL